MAVGFGHLEGFQDFGVGEDFRFGDRDDIISAGYTDPETAKRQRSGSIPRGNGEIAIAHWHEADLGLSSSSRHSAVLKMVCRAPQVKPCVRGLTS